MHLLKPGSKVEYGRVAPRLQWNLMLNSQSTDERTPFLPCLLLDSVLLRSVDELSQSVWRHDPQLRSLLMGSTAGSCQWEVVDRRCNDLQALVTGLAKNW